jgi:hypothetical protein
MVRLYFFLNKLVKIKYIVKQPIESFQENSKVNAQQITYIIPLKTKNTIPTPMMNKAIKAVRVVSPVILNGNVIFYPL